MFGRKKEAETPPELVEEPAQQQYPGSQKKGRPTPTRKEQEAARRRPLVPDDRKAARLAEREAARRRQMETRIALETGDESRMPVRDRGPQKRFARDYVDARWSLGEWLMLIVVLWLVASFTVTGNFQAQAIMYGVLWTVMGLVLLEAFLRSRGLKKALMERFGEIEPGTVWYGVTRQMQLRRLRMPKPQVARGEEPRR